MVEEAVRLASKGVKAASELKYPEAIELFNKAIELNPEDYRFYLNKSFCLYHIKDFQQSLVNAEIAISYLPKDGAESAKPFFRKAIALFDMGHYLAAEKAFQEVLKRDLQDQESRQMMIVAKKRHSLQRQNNAFSKESSAVQAVNAVVNVKKEESEAMDVNKTMTRGSKHRLRRPVMESAMNRTVVQKSTAAVLEEAKMNVPDIVILESQATNLQGFKGLFVSNISLSAKKSDIINLFSKFGEVTGCSKIKNEANDCVIVIIDYTNTTDPLTALKVLKEKIFGPNAMTQNHLKPLFMRLTANKEQKQTENYSITDGQAKTNEAEECFWWRGPLGCENRHECPLKHERSNYGIDSYSVFMTA